MSVKMSGDQIVAASESPLLQVAQWWERVPLGDVATVQNGAPFDSKKFNAQGDGLPLIRIRDVGAGDTSDYYSGEYDDEYLVQAGDLLVGMDGDFRAAHWRGRVGLLNQRVCRIAVRDMDLYDPRFLALCLQPYLDEVHKVTSAITVKHLSSKTISELTIPLPPLGEQSRVADELERRLSHVQAGERSLRLALRKLASAEASLAEAAVTGALIPTLEAAATAHAEAEALVAAQTGHSPRAKWRTVTAADLGGTPEEWGTVPLGHIVSDADYGTSHKATTTPGGVPVIRIPNIRPRSLNLTDLKYVPGAALKDAQLLQVGDVLFIRSNGSSALIGVAAAVTEAAVDHAFASYLIRFRLADAVMAKWVELVALAPSRRRWLVEQASSSAGQNNLGQPDIASMPIPVPARTDIVRILAEYERRQSLLRASQRTVEAQLKRCAAARTSILTAAFSGQLVPQDPADEPATTLLERIKVQRAGKDHSKKPARRPRAKKETTP